VSKKSDKGLPSEVVEHWPEVLADLDVQAIPLDYVSSVIVAFNDGKVWDIDLNKTKENSPDEPLEDILEDLFKEYEDYITNIDFRLDTPRLKKDIQQRTRKFLKKRK
jgi:hypothetical protein